MRWLFHDPDDRREAAARKRALGRIGDWWDAFERKSPALVDFFTGKRKWDLPGWMQDTLQEIDQHLCWEFGPALKTEGHRLVITPEHRHYLRPLVRAILDRAPDVPGFEFYQYRPAESLEHTKATVEGRTGGTIDGVLVEATRGEGNLVDLLFYSPATKGEEDEQATHLALVATETLLGERNLNRWVGVIAVEPLPAGEKPKHAIPLSRLKDTFDALVDSIRDNLPDRPYVKQPVGDKWALIQLKPTKADDYPGQEDLLVATARDVELWKATHSHKSFHSQRFSRFKETFAYVKIDLAGRQRGKDTEERGEIEDAIDDRLEADGLGIHVSGGTGLRYSYIDLALTDLDRGVEKARRVLSKLNVPERSWILFHDADLGAEWVGVYPETPEPPLAEE
jgi:hypothetical protein